MATDIQEKQKEIVKFIESKGVIERLGRALPAGTFTPAQFCRIVLSTMVKTPSVFLCTRDSIFEALLLAAELGLPPSGPLGLSYFVPYGPKCEFVPGYKGLITLARRSGYVASITAEPVHAGDDFKYRLGLTPVLEHVPFDMLDLRDQSAQLSALAMAEDKKANDPYRLIAAYSVLTLKDSTKEFKVVTQRFIDRIKKASKSSNHPDSPWNQWEEAMWCKTAIKQCLKFAPLSPEDRLVRLLSADDAREGLTSFDPLAGAATGSEEVPPDESKPKSGMDSYAEQQRSSGQQSSDPTSSSPGAASPSSNGTAASEAAPKRSGKRKEDRLQQPATRRR